VAVLLLRFPQLKSEQGLVRDRLLAAGADDQILSNWSRIVQEPITEERDEDEF
jgi:hypothetical protein